MVTAVKVSEFDLTSVEQARVLGLAAGEGRGAVRARIVLACSEPGVGYARLADEVGVSIMTVHNVRRRFVESGLAGLEADIRQWIDTWNENPRPFTWTKTADEILNSRTKYLARISDATH